MNLRKYILARTGNNNSFLIKNKKWPQFSEIFANNFLIFKKLIITN